MSLTLDVPLLASASPELEHELAAHLTLLANRAQEALGDDLIAVVVGGSLARAAGVVLRSVDGERLLSDLDLYLVVRSPSNAATRRLETQLREIHQGSRFCAAPLDLGIVPKGWFASLPPTLPAHQLAHGHRVLWSAGNSYEVQIAAVDRESSTGVDHDDALRLMMNRFAEQLLLVQRLREVPADPFALYHRWKLCLDAPLAWLAIRGLYHPERTEQQRRLASIWEELGSPRPSWWAEGLGLQEAIHSRLTGGPIEFADLENLRPSVDWDGMAAILEGLGEVRRGRIPELNWAWPFFRDGLRSTLSDSHEDPGVALQRAVEEGAPGTIDLVLALRWLRRKPLMSRLREARQWQNLGPGPISPWYRHGADGCAPERVQMACALRFGGMNSWHLPLKGIIPREEMEKRLPHRGEELDLWLGRLWSGWVMGGSRE